MSKRFLRSGHARRESGYALLLTVFLTTILVLTAIVAAPSVRTERQREKEEEMIWRGKQYVRGIKLYHRKNGRFPTSLDDLIKPKNGSLRFLRQAYKDPMNKTDGTWRLIYVGPAGQLIGSLKPPKTLQLPTAGGAQVGTPAAALANPNTQPGQPGATTQPGTTALPGATPAGAAGNTPTTGTAAGDSTASDAAAPPLKDTPTIIGGNIVGVGSKADRRSVIIYEKAKNYRLFEFIWDPSKDVMTVGGQPGGQVGTPIAPKQGFGDSFGQSGFGRGGQSGFSTQPGGFGTQPSNNPMGQPGLPPLAPSQPQPQPQQ